MSGIFLAWLVSEGIISFRAIRRQGGPPWPGQLLWVSGAFVLLAVIGQAQQARQIANVTAWGLVAAAFLDLFGKFPTQTAGSGWWAAVTQSAGSIPPQDILPPGGITGSGQGGAAGRQAPQTPAHGPAPGTPPIPPAPGPSSRFVTPGTPGGPVLGRPSSGSSARAATPAQIRSSFPIIRPRARAPKNYTGKPLPGPLPPTNWHAPLPVTLWTPPVKPSGRRRPPPP